LGSAEAIIRDSFKKARSVRPCIIFFDEIETIVGKRSLSSGEGDSGVGLRVLSTLLNELDGIEQSLGITVMAATNRIDMIDAALLRPGRFDLILHVPPPDEEARIEILQIHTRKIPLHVDVDLKYIAKKTDRFTGAELENLCREAALCALRRNLDSSTVQNSDFNYALQLISPALAKVFDVSQFFVEKK